MANIFDGLFTEDMTEKQVCFRYWATENNLQLTRGSTDYDALRQAYLKAVNAAQRRSFANLARIEKEKTKDGIVCICQT